MMNNVTLVGRLSKDIELRYTGSGIAVASFTLAVERSYTNAQGERETDFVNCVIWRAPAENLANFAVKGSLIGITGAIQTRNYENNEGRKTYVTEVVANNFQLLEPKAVTDKRREQAGQSNQNNQQGQQQNTQQSQQQNNNQFGNNDYSNDPFASYGTGGSK